MNDLKGDVMENWQSRLKKARKLRKQGSEVLYERINLLCQCYEEEGFREWCETQGVNDIDYLDEELNDTAATFLTLKAVLAEHPRREDWVQNNIRDLIAKAIEAEKSRMKANEIHRVSWKQRAIEAERECERLRAELRGLKESLASFAGGQQVA